MKHPFAFSESWVRRAVVVCVALGGFYALPAGAPIINPPGSPFIVTTLTPNGSLYGNGTGPIQATAQGPLNSVLTANAGAPSFSATPTVTSIQANSGSTIQTLNIGLGGNGRSNNTAVGVSALSANTGGTENTALGYLTLTNNANATDNTGLGFQALQTNTSGGANTAVGAVALQNNISGSSNTAVGRSALISNTGDSNTGVGTTALSSNTTGANNVAVGLSAGVTATGGNANVSGSNNVWIGYQSGPGTATQLTNSIAIGYQALNTASNEIVLGNTNHTATTLRGTVTAPTFTTLASSGGQGLVIQNTVAAGAFEAQVLGAGGADRDIFQVAQTTFSNGFTVQRVGASMKYTFNDGSLGIVGGTLTVSGIASSGAAQSGYLCYNTVGGVITYDGGATCLVSRESEKVRVGAISNALKIVLALDPFWGKYKDSSPAADKHVQPFLGARQVASVDARLVSVDKKGEPLGVRYENTVAVLVGAIKEQQALIVALERRLASLERDAEIKRVAYNH
jgi:hypothetical protein